MERIVSSRQTKSQREGYENMNAIYTVGYSGYYYPTDLVDALKNYGIDVVVDVRSSPFSAGMPQYNRDNIERIFKNNKIHYRNYSREFGARQTDHRFYRDGRLDFPTFTASEQFNEGVEKIKKALSMGYTPCLMCAEKDPINCHRAIMITRALHDSGYSIIHLLPNGEIESQLDIESQLINCLDMFDRLALDEQHIVEVAYKKKNDEIGYKEASLR